MSQDERTNSRAAPSLAQAVIAGLIIICITLVGFIGNNFHTKQIQVMENQAIFRAEVGAAQGITNLRLKLIEEHLDEAEQKYIEGDR